MAKTLREHLHALLAKIKKLMRGGSMFAEESELVRAQETVNKWHESLSAAIRNAENNPVQTSETAQDDGARMYIETYTDAQGKTSKRVRADGSRVLSGRSPSQWGRQIIDWITGIVKEDGKLDLVTQDGSVLTITDDSRGRRFSTAGELSNFNDYYDENGVLDETAEIRAKASLYIDEIVQVSQDKPSPDKNGEHEEIAVNGWKYRTVFFVDADGKTYRIRLSVAQGINGEQTAYGLGGVRQRIDHSNAGTSLSGAQLAETDSYISSISTPSAKRNPSAENSQSDGERSMLDVDSYTERQYNKRGWALVNNVVGGKEARTFFLNIGDMKNGAVFPETSDNRFIMAVGDKFGVNNVLIVTNGNHAEPSIDRVYWIDLDNETDIEIVRDYIYECEDDTQFTARADAQEIYGETLVQRYARQNYPAYKELRAGSGSRSTRGSSLTNQRHYRFEQDGSGDTGEAGNAVTTDNAQGTREGAFSSPETRSYLDADAPVVQRLFSDFSAEEIKEMFERLNRMKSTGVFALKDIERMLDTVSGGNKELRNLLDGLIGRPHREATGRYAHGTDAANKRMLEVVWLSGLERSLGNNEYVIFLQPKIDAVTEQIRGAEALVRRIEPDGSVISAGPIIEALERKGFVSKLDYYVLGLVCQFLGRCIAEGRQVCPISSNFSRVHLFDPEFPARVAAVVDAHGIPRGLIEIELTETAFLAGKDVLQTMVRRLHENGFSVAIDDFGSGYSSLNMLKDVEADVIKLDREFLTGFTENRRADTVISHTLHLAQEMHITAVAEGIETAEQLAFLRELGCDLIQGYYFSHPLPENAFKEKYL